MSSLTFLLGRANRGKSAHIREQLRGIQSSGRRAVLIVPPQYSFETEQSLTKALGGLLGIQVLSHERLVDRVLDLQGDPRTYLSSEGYRMVIRRSLIEQCDSLLVFGRAAGQPGFAEEVSRVLSEFRRERLTPELLEKLVSDLPEDHALRDKLTDLLRIYRDTESFLEERYLTAEGRVLAAAERIPDSFLSGIPVFYDGFESPSALDLLLFERILTTASDVSVSLLIDPDPSGDADLFLPEAQTRQKLTDLAVRHSVPVRSVAFHECRKNPAPPFRYIEQNFFARSRAPFSKPAPEIRLFAATSREAEAERLAEQVLSCARDGLRFRDMAVMASDLERCGDEIARAFQKRKIPFFLDRRRPLSCHAAADTVLSALDCITEDFRPEDLLRLAKSGYAGADQSDTEDLENYLLAYGLKGSALTRPLSRGTVPPGAERAWNVLVPPLLTLREGLHAQTISGKILALYSYLETIGLEQQLHDVADALRKSGRIALMQEHAQVWNLLVSTMEQLYGIMGDIQKDRKTFSRLFSEGLSGRSIGVIPDTADQVLIGDMQRSKVRAVSALFLFGINDGLFPRNYPDDGLFNDRERGSIQEKSGCHLQETLSLIRRDRLDLYIVFSRALSRLYVSYALSDSSGTLLPSPLIRELKQCFPSLKEDSDLLRSSSLPSSDASGLSMLSSCLRGFRETPGDSVLGTLLAYYSRKQGFDSLVEHMKQAQAPFPGAASLDPAFARAAFGASIRFSASKLEKFNSCPYRFFLDYFLSLRERREFRELPQDFGTLYHAVLDAFVKTVLNRHMDWKEISEDQVSSLISEILPVALREHNNQYYLENKRANAQLFLLSETIRRSASAMCRQIQAGDFVPIGSELGFGSGPDCRFPALPIPLSSGETAFLSGWIDRVDQAVLPDGRILRRVVDLKTGRRDFDYSGILSGQTLQLVLYLDAVSRENAEPAGLYYMPLNIPELKEDKNPEEDLVNAFRLRGLTLSDPQALHATEHVLQGSSRVLQNVKSVSGQVSGSVCTPAELSVMSEKVREISASTADRILSGDISIRPTESACDYCRYSGICGFDQTRSGCRLRKPERLKRDQFFDLIRKENDPS